MTEAHHRNFGGVPMNDFPTLELDPRIDHCKPVSAQAQAATSEDRAAEAAASMLKELTPHQTAQDDPALWEFVLRNVLMDIDTRDVTHDLPLKRFIKFGVCSHWFRPHQSRWTAAGGFAWPSGWHGVSGFSRQGLPELDWSMLFELSNFEWTPVRKFSGKDRLEIRIAVPARTARHQQAAIHTLWSPMNHRVFYGLRKKDNAWTLAARSDFYGDEDSNETAILLTRS